MLLSVVTFALSRMLLMEYPVVKLTPPQITAVTRIRSDRTPDREMAESDAPYAKLPRLHAENERIGSTHAKLKLKITPAFKTNGEGVESKPVRSH